MGQTIDFYRTLSRLFTNEVFRSVSSNGHSEYLVQSLQKYADALQITDSDTGSVILQKAYRQLCRHYRSEYFYKNTIANKLLLGRHNLNTTTLLSEFRVGGSIADLVMLNGTSSVYEIKTELDSPEKLQKQIADYQRAFTQINLVTHHPLTARYEKLLKNSVVGLYSLGARQQLTEVQPATYHVASLNTEVMLRSLRKEEYSAVVHHFWGEVPAVPNTQFFKACLAALRHAAPQEVHDQAVVALKKRNVRHKDFFEQKLVPRELIHICLCLDLSPQQFDRLIHFLNNPVSSCIFPTSDANNSNYLRLEN